MDILAINSQQFESTSPIKCVVMLSKNINNRFILYIQRTVFLNSVDVTNFIHQCDETLGKIYSFSWIITKLYLSDLEYYSIFQNSHHNHKYGKFFNVGQEILIHFSRLTQLFTGNKSLYLE